MKSSDMNGADTEFIENEGMVLPLVKIFFLQQGCINKPFELNTPEWLEFYYAKIRWIFK